MNNETIKLVQEARTLFGLGGAEWSITIQETEYPGEDRANLGFTTVDSTYMNATIQLVPNATRETVYHEVLHVLHDQVDLVVEDIIEQIGEDDRQYFSDIYKRAIEKFIQHLARNICAGLKTTEKGE